MALGTLATPALIRLWREQSNPSGRYATLAAISLAQGAATDAFVIERLAQPDHVRERVFALLCLALGPSRDRGGEAVAKLLSSGRSGAVRPVLRVAASLAGRGYGLEPSAEWYADEDPGVAAAVRFCRARPDDAALERWVGPRQREHGDLVLRGAMLGAQTRGSLAPSLESRVRDFLADTVRTDLAGASALCAARAIPADVLFAGADASFPRLWLVPLLATNVEHSRAMMPRLSTAVRSGRLGATERVRIAVALARALPTLDSQAARDCARSMAEDASPDVRHAFLLAIAARLFEHPAERAGSEGLELPQDPAIGWVALARGEAAGDLRFSDGALSRAFAKAKAGDLPARAAARCLRDALWRSGAEPELARHEAEVDLVRDLLVSGSDVGRGVDAVAPGASVYFAKGLARGDAMFDVAMRLLRFVRANAPGPRSARGRYR